MIAQDGIVAPSEFEQERCPRMIASATVAWAGFLALSVVADAGATASLKVAGDRIDGFGFFWAAVVGLVAFAPSIVLFGYALRSGSS